MNHMRPLDNCIHCLYASAVSEESEQSAVLLTAHTDTPFHSFGHLSDGAELSEGVVPSFGYGVSVCAECAYDYDYESQSLFWYKSPSSELSSS